MKKDLRKNLEEVALDMYPPRIGDIVYKHCDVNADTREILIEGGTIGYELGYKEAIKAAKEWMRNYFPDELDGKGFEFVKLDTILDDFETDMNKLWEEK